MFGKEFENLHFEQWKILMEMKIRGRFISLSTNLEYFIIKIIVYCDAKNPEISRKFKSYMLGKKLTWMKEDLKRYFPQKFNYLSVAFEMLENKLLSIRNHMAHCEMFFDENEQDRSFIEIRDIKFIDAENKFERTKYSVDELQEAEQEFREVNKYFLKVWKELVDEYNSNQLISQNSLPLNIIED